MNRPTLGRALLLMGAIALVSLFLVLADDQEQQRSSPSVIELPGGESQNYAIYYRDCTNTGAAEDWCRRLAREFDACLNLGADAGTCSARFNPRQNTEP